MLLKEGKRKIQEIKKTLFIIYKIEDYNPKLGIVKINPNKKHKIDKIKRKRLFVADASAKAKAKN